MAIVSSPDAGFELLLRSPPRAKSKVWQYFGFREDNGEIVDTKKVFCRLCKRSLSYSGNTTNLMYHLQTVHPTEHKEIAQNKCDGKLTENAEKGFCQTTVSGCFSSKLPYPRGSSRHKTCEESLVEFLVKDYQALRVVECPAFLHFVQTLDSRYKPSSRTHFSRVLIPTKYDEVKSSLRASLSLSQHISFTTDLWTGCHNQSYISLSAHYISPTWEMKHHCLSTWEISVAHTAVNIAKELREEIVQWGLTDKVYGFTTDNGQNVANAVVDHLNYPHLGCIGHTLQLSVGKALSLSSVARVVGRVKKLVEHFRRSSKATYALREKQALLDVKKHELIQEVATRWGSTYAMLERVAEQQACLCAVLLDEKDRSKRSLLPDTHEWTLIEELIAVLEPFVKATTAMSGSSYPTVSMLSPLLYKLLRVSLAHKDEDSATIRQVKDVVAEDLRNRYAATETAQMLNMCAFLDPRFKNLDPFIPECERKDVTEEVKLELLSLAKKQCHAAPDAGSPLSPVSNHSGDSSQSYTHSSESEGAKTLEQEQPPTKRLKPGVVSSLFADIATARSSKKPSTLELVESELNRYEQEELLDLDSDPLLWWKTHQVQYPILSQLLKQLWSLPATSVRSEEIFSSAGNVLTQQRNRLLPEMVNMLVFLHDNM